MADKQPPGDSSDNSPLPVDPTLDATLDSGPSAAGPGGYPGEKPGTLIGRYRLMQMIGEGGFGSVFLAQQQEPVSRQVALKVIKLGMDTKQVIARFEAERQALAMMDHPNIAKVFDAGTTEAGRPYFVMELVKGIPITKYCDRNKMSTTERLELFQQVCAAVQHAHQKGIIHRDIKPSNVLVSDTEGKPVPKVIDFGIAKATHQRLTEKTVLTQQSVFIGTPEYMSPEQAEVSAMDIDTRSDIYSLGVLLYELLAGATPFDGAKLRSAAYGEIQRIIREDEPPMPSTRASSLGEGLEEVASHRRQRGSQLVKNLKGELDWIIMKCLEKDRTRRYETANGLASDLQRFLTNEPVAASPPSQVYRFKKLVVRNRTAFAAGAAMVLLLTAGGIGTTVGLVRATKAEKEAVAEAAKSDQVASFLTDMLSGVGPSAARGRDTEMLEEILQETHESIGEELEGQPEVEGEIRSYLGTTYFDLGESELAKVQFSAALELLEEAYGSKNDDVAKQNSNLGLVHESLQEYEEAEERYHQALAIRIELLGEVHPDVAEYQMNLANLYVSMGRYDDAEPILLEALDVLRESSGDNDENLATCLNSLGNLMQHLGRYPEAEPYYEEALALHTKVLGEDHPFVITDMVNMAWLSFNLGEYAEADRRFGEAVVIGRRIYGDGHPNLVENIKGQARCQQQLGNFAESEVLYNEALEMSIEIFGPDHLNTADVLSDMATVLSDLDRNEESEAMTLRVLAIQREQLGETHPSTLTTLQNFAYAVFKRGELEKAEKLFLESVVAFEAAYGHDNKQTALVINNLGRVYRAQGNYPKAEESFIESGAIRARVLGEDHFLVAVSSYDLGLAREGERKLDDAIRILEEALPSFVAALDSTHQVVGGSMIRLAGMEIDRGNYQAAIEWAQHGRALRAATAGEENEDVYFADFQSALALGLLGSVEEADAQVAVLAPKLGDQKPKSEARLNVWYGEYLTSVGRYSTAETALLRAHELFSAEYPDGFWRTRQATDLLVKLYEAWSAAGDAAAAGKLDQWRLR